MSEKYEFVIIDKGHNGLTVASDAAKAVVNMQCRGVEISG